MLRKERDFPTLSKELIEEAEESFSHYLFYERDDLLKGRKITCSRCGGTKFLPDLERVMSSDDNDCRRAKHNEEGICPFCGSKVVFKSIGKSRSRSSLWEQHKFCFFIPEGENLVRIAAAYCYRNYCHTITPKTQIDIVLWYEMEPGKATRWKYDRYHGGFFDMKNPFVDPFTTSGLYASYESYYFVNRRSLKGTFLRYVDGDNFAERSERWARNYWYSCPSISYYCLSAVHPQTEMLMKLGFEQIIVSYLIGKPLKRLVDWNARTPYDFFKMSKQEFNDFMKEPYFRADVIHYLKIKAGLEKYGVKYRVGFLAALYKEYPTQHADILTEIFGLSGLSFSKVKNYLDKQGSGKTVNQEAAIMWRDYLSAAQKLKLGSDDIVLRPKNLKKAHDVAFSNLALIVRQKNDDQLLKRQPQRIKQYSYENENFLIRPPVSIQEIINEGKLMNHCVGNYAERHAKGETTILFLRSKKAPESPLYTIEIKGTRVIQCQGKGNRTPLTAPAKAFFEDWKKWVAGGSVYRLLECARSDRRGILQKEKRGGRKWLNILSVKRCLLNCKMKLTL